MEANGWRPAPAAAPAPAESGASTAELPSAADWRSQLPPDSRQRIVSKIMETLKRHLPISVPEGLNELHKIAVRFEEKIFSAATSQPDYLRKISLKMLSMESKTQNTAQSSNVVSQSPGESASIGIQPQANNQSLPMSMVNQNPTRQHIFQQNIPNNSLATVQNSANMPSALSSISGLNQSSISSAVQTSNLQNMSGISQNAVSNSVGRNTTADVYTNAQMQMQGRKQQQPIISQQQPQNQLLYQQQLMKQKLQPSLLQPHLQQQQQQQQQSLLQTAQLQSSQQPLMQMSSSIQPAQSSILQTQPGTMQSTIQSGVQQNQLNSVQQSVPSMLHQHSQSVVRQQHQTQPAMHQQTSLQQQSTSLPQSSLQMQQHQQQLIGSQANNTQQELLHGPQASITDMQPQPQSISIQQNNLLNMQQSQHNISLHQQQQLGRQNNNITVLQQQHQQQQQQQQQLLGSLPSVSNMQPNQRAMHIMQQSKTSVHQQEQLQNKQASMSGLQQQVQQSQHQSSQQQLMSQFQNQSAQLQQHLSMQQHKNSISREMQQRLQGPGVMLSQNVIEQQKQFGQPQRGLPEVSSSTSMDSTAQTTHGGTDWQEEAYQKIKSMKDLYFTDLSEMYQKISIKIQQHEASVPSLNPSSQYDKIKNFKTMLERTLQILQLPKGSIQPTLKDKLPVYEKQIAGILASHKKKVILSQPPGHQQFQHSGGLVAQHQSSQLSQFQQHDMHANQVQQMNLQGSTASMQSLVITQHGSMPLSTQFGPSTVQQNMVSSLQSGSVIDQAQGSSFNPQQIAMCSTQQNGMVSGQSMINVPPQHNPNTMTNTLQQHNLKQLQEQQQQHLIQTQQMKQQLQQRHLQQQQHLMQQQHKQQLLQTQQSLQTQQKQQQTTQVSIHQMPLHQTTEPNELKVRQAPGMKSGPYQSHYPGGQRLNYYQQFKPSSNFPISSPQNPQVSSPQISHHSSPQIDQLNLLLSEVKSGTPAQSANSPFAPSPSTPLAPSPLPAETEKPPSGISPLSNGGHVGIQPSSLALPQVPSLSVATPGMSASPLLAEFISPDNQTNVQTSVPNTKSAEESPVDRLLKLVGSSKPNVLGPAMNDIASVISMIDIIAGSAPGNGSRAAVGEDLVPMTKCRIQARNSISQDGNVAKKKMKRDTVAVPLVNVTSAGTVNESFKQLCSLDTSELESTATSCVKQQKREVNNSLFEEIREINLRLIDTVIEITEENADSFADKAEGTVIRFSHTAVSLSPSLKSHFASINMTPILPLRLLVPANYPTSSPVVLDKLPDEPNSDSDHLSIKAKSRFSSSLRGLSKPLSIRDIVKTWDACVRKVIVEYAENNGGGCFTTIYGTWETACVLDHML